MKLVNYQQQGNGPDIILIHGLFGSLENLNMVARALASSYRVTSIDVRNHGQSFHLNEMSYQSLANDIVRLLDFLKITSTAVLGHSMGGKIAMQLAFSQPERINKLIVADIAPVQYPAHHQKIIEGLKAIELTKVTKRSDADTQLAAYVENQGVRQFLLRNVASKNGQFYFKCQLDFIGHCYPQIMAALDNTQCFTGPTLFIKGGASDYLQAAHKDIINRLFPNSKVKVIAGAGHWLHAEKTTIFNKILHDFLTS